MHVADLFKLFIDKFSEEIKRNILRVTYCEETDVLELRIGYTIIHMNSKGECTYEFDVKKVHEKYPDTKGKDIFADISNAFSGL